MVTRATDPERVADRAVWAGLVAALLLMAVALAVPLLSGWQVHSHGRPGDLDVAPLHAKWAPKVGSGTLPALLVASLGLRYAVAWADRLPWARLLLVCYVGGLAWLVALAYVDGSEGISRVLGHGYEYLETARATDDVPGMLEEYAGRIPYAAPDNYPTHVAGHPPGALLVFVVLHRLGLGGDWAAGMVVTLLAASTSVAVLVALRALGAEHVARRAAPFLVLGPAAVWMAVSADALFGAVAAWGLCALALGATRDTTFAGAGWSALAGLLLGYCVMMSYGLPLLGLLAVAVLVAARSWRPLPVAVATALLVVLAFAATGFVWWEAFPVLRERYWDGVARVRPASYWLWGNLAALCFSAGPVLGAALGRLGVLGRRADRTVLLLVGAATATIAVADLSGMSKAEVERIWLPFVPWLLLSTSALPERWRRAGLGVQLGIALVVQHLLYTSW